MASFNVSLVDSEFHIDVGENTVAAAASAVAAAASAAAAALSEGAAESLVGPTYASTAAGIADTVDGEFFAVDNGDGTVTIYLNVAETAVAQRTLATTAALAAPDGLERLGFAQGSAPYIQTRKALEKLREIGASAKDFGALGDNTTDDADAVEKAFVYFAGAGGEWRIPKGRYLLKRMIDVPAGLPQIISGCGQRGVYPGAFNPATATELAVFVPVHNGRAAFQFTGSTGETGLTIRDLAVTTLESGLMPTCAFGWLTNDGFVRTYEFDRVSINGFNSAFDTYKTGGTNTEAGIFRASHCNIHRNLWIARSLDGTQWNGFSFVHNEAGQNGYLVGQGGIAISGHNVHIVDNILEGMRDPVKVTGGFLGINVQSNYLEACVGRALVELSSIRGHYKVGPNAPLALDYGNLDNIVLLRNCGPGEVVGPYWPENCHKVQLPVLGNSSSGYNTLNPNINTDDYGYLRLDGFDSGQTYLREPELLAKSVQRVTVAGRELAPWNGEVLPVAQYTTSGAGGIANTYTIAGSSGDWVVVSWLFKRTPDAGAAVEPYVSLAVNGVSGSGGRDYVANDYNLYWRDGEWVLATCAIKLGATMTSLTVTAFPHGVSPAAGRVTRYLKPVVYTTDTPNKIVPYIDDYIARSMTTNPNAPGFLPGDIVKNGAPAGSGQGEFLKLAGADDNWVFA